MRMTIFLTAFTLFLSCQNNGSDQTGSSKAAQEQQNTTKMDPTLNALSEIFERDLRLFRKKIKAYKDTSRLWLTPGEVNNSAGNLCLHIEGNLKYFIGHVLGGSDYQRNRDYEFSASGFSRQELLKRLEETEQVVTKTLDELDPSTLDDEYPKEVVKKGMTTRFFLIHLATHLRYHLGQVDYHRRLVDTE